MIVLEILVILPFLGALVAYLAPGSKAKNRIFMAVSLLHVVFSTIVIATGDHYGEVLGIDDQGRLMLGLLSYVNVFCTIAGIDYIHSARRSNNETYVPFALLSLGAMTLALCTLHMGVFWVAVEATTLATAPLIYNHRTRESLEATWKYLVLCSVGIALALLGTFFFAIALSGATYPTSWDVLSLQDMVAAAEKGHVDKLWLRMAFLLMLVGYGTKAGLAPVHSWLPDAHAECPAPMSAFLSGLVLNVALLGILRALKICDAAEDVSFAQDTLVCMGLLSLLTAAVFLHGQKDFKRMLAYSSVENMGLIALGVGLGGLSARAAMWLIVNHSIVKSMLFLCAGSFVRSYGTHAVAEIQGAKYRTPITAALWLCGLLAISGMPPFGIFPAKLMLLVGAIQSGRYLILGIVILALFWIFMGMSRTMLGMIFDNDWKGSGKSITPEVERKGIRKIESPWFWGPSLALAITSIVLGTVVPARLSRAIQAGGEQAVVRNSDAPVHPVILTGADSGSR